MKKIAIISVMLGLILARETNAQFYDTAEELVYYTLEWNGERFDDGRPKAMSDDIRVMLFQAVRELLVNVVKHAKAQHVTVSAQRLDDKIEICVGDDGVGFDASGPDSLASEKIGFGLFSIRERISLAGGTFNINSKVGQGTEVTITVSIGQESKEGRKTR